MISCCSGLRTSEHQPSSSSGLRPGRHRKRRKTETSSGASDEAPERARKDAPKEVNCIMRAVTLLLRLSGEVSQASIRRVPCPQERFRETAPAREICSPRRSGDAPVFRAGNHYCIKSDPRTGVSGGKTGAAPRSRQTVPRPQARPGSLSRVSA